MEAQPLARDILAPLVRQELSVVVCAPHSTVKLVRQARIVLSVIVHPRGVYRTDFGSWPSSGEGRGDAQHSARPRTGLRCCASCGSPPLHMMVLYQAGIGLSQK